MPVAGFSIQIDPQLRIEADRLGGLAKQVTGSLQRATLNLGALMADELRRTTPMSEEPGDHLADGWTTRPLDDVPKDADFGIEVHNPRDFEVDSSHGKTSLLNVLEFGSRQHKITPKDKSRLVFFWPAVGAIVFAKSVEHPGTRPYAFMLDATDNVLDRAAKLLDALARVLPGGS